MLSRKDEFIKAAMQGLVAHYGDRTHIPHLAAQIGRDTARNADAPESAEFIDRSVYAAQQREIEQLRATVAELEEDTISVAIHNVVMDQLQKSFDKLMDAFEELKRTNDRLADQNSGLRSDLKQAERSIAQNAAHTRKISAKLEEYQRPLSIEKWAKVTALVDAEKWKALPPSGMASLFDCAIRQVRAEE